MLADPTMRMMLLPMMMANPMHPLVVSMRTSLLSMVGQSAIVKSLRVRLLPSTLICMHSISMLRIGQIRALAVGIPHQTLIMIQMSTLTTRLHIL
jgi:hypothetical protein